MKHIKSFVELNFWKKTKPMTDFPLGKYETTSKIFKNQNLNKIVPTLCAWICDSQMINIF